MRVVNEAEASVALSNPGRLMMEQTERRQRRAGPLHGRDQDRCPGDRRDELQDFGGNSDVLNLMHDRISILTHVHPFPPIP